MFDDIKSYYDEGFYTNENMKVFVTGGWITEAEYESITGEIYSA